MIFNGFLLASIIYRVLRFSLVGRSVARAASAASHSYGNQTVLLRSNVMAAWLDQIDDVVRRERLIRALLVLLKARLA